MATLYELSDFGAVSDGKTDNSAVFAQVLEKIRLEGGGTVLVPPGEFLTGPLELFDNTTLFLARGATLCFVADQERYEPIETRWEGIMCHAMHPLIFASHSKNIHIGGEGTIDGNGRPWWEAYRRKRAEKQEGPVSAMEKRLAGLNGFDGRQPSGGGGREMQFLRPSLVQFLCCENVEVEGVTLRDSPFWTIHPIFSVGISIRDVKIANPSDAPNTDGIDIDSCSDVSITGTTVDVGDDCIALKSGSGEQGLREGMATRNVSIAHCTFLSGHGGVVIGSETAGGIENVEVVNCRFVGSDRGIRIKSRRGRGGTVQNLSFRNLFMANVLSPLTINLFYNCGSRAEEAGALFSQRPQEVSPLTPHLRNIYVSNLIAENCRASAGFVAGLPESKIENLRLENCVMKISDRNLEPTDRSEMYQGIAGTSHRGLRMRHVECTMDNVKIENCDHPGILEEEGAVLTMS